MIYKIVRYMEECKKTSQDQGQSMQKEKVLKQFQFANTCTCVYIMKEIQIL